MAVLLSLKGRRLPYLAYAIRFTYARVPTYTTSIETRLD